MAGELQLQPRLQLLAHLVPQGAKLADIGTDHGYLPAYLLQKKQIASAIAADIGPAPLEHARRTAAKYGVEKSLRFLQCDGLAGIGPEDADTIVIAGMGGETIIHILSQAPWTKEGKVLLLLQPMTKQEDLRLWLNENNYAQYAERLVWDKGYLYPVFTVFGGSQTALSAGEIYGGLDIEVDPLGKEYLTQRIRRLEQATEGLLKGSDPANGHRAQELKEIIHVLTERRNAL